MRCGGGHRFERAESKNLTPVFSFLPSAYSVGHIRESICYGEKKNDIRCQVVARNKNTKTYTYTPTIVYDRLFFSFHLPDPVQMQAYAQDAA